MSIILVVLGYAAVASIVGKYILFSYTTFFIISGMCFNNGKYKLKELMKKSFMQLFLLVIWSVSFMFVVVVNRICTFIVGKEQRNISVYKYEFFNSYMLGVCITFFIAYY